MSKPQFAASRLMNLLLAGLLGVFLITASTAMATAVDNRPLPPPAPADLPPRTGLSTRTTASPALPPMSGPIDKATGRPVPLAAAPVPVPEAPVAAIPVPTSPAPVPGAPLPIAGLPMNPQTTAPTAQAPATEVMAVDKVTLEDVRDKLTVTRDETWLLRDRMLSMDLMKAYITQEQQLNGIQ